MNKKTFAIILYAQTEKKKIGNNISKIYCKVADFCSVEKLNIKILV